MLKRFTILLWALLLMLSFCVACNSTGTSQTQVENNTLATITAVAPLEKDMVLTQDIVVGKKLRMEVKDKFTIDIKIVSGNGKVMNPNDWVSGASVSITDPQITLVIENVMKDKNTFIRFMTYVFPDSYYLKITSLGADGQPVGTTDYLVNDIFSSGAEYAYSHKLQKPSECKGFEIRLGYNKP